MKGIVDRLEGEFVVVEVDGKTKDIPRELVDPGVRAGDVVVLADGVWKTEPGETKARSEKIRKLMDSVWED